MKRIAAICFLTLLTLTACERKPAISGGHLEKVDISSENNTSFYTGTISPLKSVVIPSPTDGVIVEMPFQYGNAVASNQLLLMISSAKFLSDYKSALMQYIKSKNDFDNGKMQLEEAEFLHKNELISDDDYKTKKTNYYANQLSLLQAKDMLETLLKQLDIKNIDLYHLTIADIDKITEAMHLQKEAENIRIISPVKGVVLSATRSEEEMKKLSIGDAVKQGDVLAVIGDMSGLSVRIKVNELAVNQLKVGQKVKVSGIAFPDTVLLGEVRRVDHQGEASNNGLPLFPVEVIVPHLSIDQQEKIHVGMSAQVEVSQSDANEIVIPLSSVAEKNGETVVSVYDEKKNRVKSVSVKTGRTLLNQVVILSGLKKGDQIVVPG